MRWLENGFESLQLDIVGFLAILGEASVTANAQVSLLSNLSLLPRLLPAPQALIRTSRPLTLPPRVGKVIGAKSGGTREYVNHIANLIHSKEHLPPYHVRCERVAKRDPQAKVAAAPWGPLGWTSLLGTAMSIALLVLSVIEQDGFALVATLLLSFLSTLIAIGSRWELDLMKRKSNRPVPKDRIVIKYPNGSFRIIQCDEYIARELYWHPEACNYKLGDTVYRLISLTGTFMLMMGVICLGNSTLPLQVAFAAAYLILNAVYWVVAALPSQWHWDLSCYQVTPEPYTGGEKNENFTTALWKAIAITQDVSWVRYAQVAPNGKGWDDWLNRAADVALPNKYHPGPDSSMEDFQKDGEPDWERAIPEWDADQNLTDCLNPPNV